MKINGRRDKHEEKKSQFIEIIRDGKEVKHRQKLTKKDRLSFLAVLIVPVIFAAYAAIAYGGTAKHPDSVIDMRENFDSYAESGGVVTDGDAEFVFSNSTRTYKTVLEMKRGEGDLGLLMPGKKKDVSKIVCFTSEDSENVMVMLKKGGSIQIENGYEIPNPVGDAENIGGLDVFTHEEDGTFSAEWVRDDFKYTVKAPSREALENIICGLK